MTLNLRQWSLMRILRLIIGTVAIVEATRQRDLLLGTAGIFLFGMAVFNIGCCGMGSCMPTMNKKPARDASVVEFEEVH